ncbi:LLM class flavin-dependent oxidoreductase [Streptomyces monashensis]|uniref:LLM class flavin-dependent oxidoreductase n=1 Tax=Streptomyces monashensis TaxID=1678012 RepID=UPI0015A56500
MGARSDQVDRRAARPARGTERVDIGTTVQLLPFEHPIHVAEHGAMVDILSNGRLRLGVGLGNFPSEFELFVLDAKHQVSRYEEGVAIVQRAWEGEELDFHGKHFNVKGRITPAPVSLELWMGATDDIGVITGDLTVRTVVGGEERTAHVTVRYTDAEECYTVTGSPAHSPTATWPPTAGNCSTASTTAKPPKPSDSAGACAPTRIAPGARGPSAPMPTSRPTPRNTGDPSRPAPLAPHQGTSRRTRPHPRPTHTGGRPSPMRRLIDTFACRPTRCLTPEVQDSAPQGRPVAPCPGLHTAGTASQRPLQARSARHGRKTRTTRLTDRQRCLGTWAFRRLRTQGPCTDDATFGCFCRTTMNAMHRFLRNCQ